MNPHDLVKLAAAALAAATTLASSYAWRTETLTPPPDAVELIAPITCTTDADCHDKHPDVPEPGHDEPEAGGPVVLEPTMADGLGSLGYQPCENEDGPGPCYWDAENMGNGAGTSYVVLTDGSVIYLP